MAERLRQLDPRMPSLAITVPLATFHASTLVLVVLGIVYFFGDLGQTLDDLNTLTGLGAFAYLWVITWVATSGALRRLGWPERASYTETSEAATYWGGVTGATIVLVAVAAAVLVFATFGVVTLDGIALLSVLIVIPFGIIAGAVAFGVGAVIGLMIGVLDYLLLRLSELVLDSVSPSELRADP